MKSKMLLYIGVLIFSVIFLTGCTSKENVSISEGLVTEGQELYEEREYKKAVEKFSEALEIYPSNFDAYVGVMNVLLGKGYFEEAEEFAQEASLRLSNEDTATIFNMIGFKYYEIDEFDSAEEMFKVVKGDELANVGLAGVYIQQKEVEKAQKVLKGPLKEAKAHLLYSYLTLEDWDKGFEKIAEVDLDEVEDEKLKERISNLMGIYSIVDEDALYKNTSLAGEYVNAGYPYLAIKLLKDQGDNINEYADAQYFLGKAYLDYGEYDKAIEKLNNAILLGMDSAEVYANLARAYLLSKNVEKSLDTYKAAIANVNINENSWIVSEYVKVLLDNNMKGAAIKLVTDLVMERDSFDLNIILADIYLKENNLDKTNLILEKLGEKQNLTQAETQDLTRYEILYALEIMADAKEIENLLERFIVFDRYNPEASLFEGKLLIRKGEDLKAKEALERAVELDLVGEIAEEANKLLATLN